MTGANIIAAITSGLGLIQNLAEEFLDGFEALMVTTPTGGTAGLSVFGTFAFVMLGVSVSFAIIKLVLNIVRGNTGA